MSAVARIYAKAFFKAAQDQGVKAADFQKEQKALKELDGIISQSKEAKIALYGPATSSREKMEIVGKMSSKLKVSSLTQNFLSVLARKGRLEVLPQLTEALDQIRLESEGGTLGTVFSSDPIDEKEVEALAAAYTKSLGFPVEFKVAVDESLIAGLKVVVNGVTYDGTLRSQLDRLREGFVQGSTVVH